MSVREAVPATVGRYRIEGVLGQGAMAVVYAGYDPGIQRQVAIKCLHSAVSADPAYRQRFLIEARAAGHLTHPNIVTIFDAGQTPDGRPYIAMERLTGESLAERVAAEGFPPLPVLVGLAEQVADALDYAHLHGIVHQDIKPENIMLAGDWQHAKVSDFGIAERRGSGEGAQLSRSAIGGTPAFMATERFGGRRGDARSDLFSLGVVLYWLVTGKLPWNETEDVRRLLAERQRTPVPAIAPRDPATPEILLDIIRTLLSPIPEERYQRGSEVIDDLRQARREFERLHETPLATRIVSLRLRWAAILGAVLALTLLLGMAAIYAKESYAVSGLAEDFGGSLGRMVASEAAENLLLGDHAATRALVEDVARNRQIHYLAIADRYGKTVASTRPADVGQPLTPIKSERQLPGPGEVASSRGHLPGGDAQDEMLLFDLPIRYQAAQVGRLRLGISTAPLRAAQKTTQWVIVAVLVVTLAVVLGAAYWLFRRLLAMLSLLGDAMLRSARGDWGYRIRLVRRDELGRLFAAFNVMNSALQARQRQAAGKPATGRPAEPAMELPTRIIGKDG